MGTRVGAQLRSGQDFRASFTLLGPATWLYKEAGKLPICSTPCLDVSPHRVLKHETQAFCCWYLMCNTGDQRADRDGKHRAMIEDSSESQAGCTPSAWPCFPLSSASSGSRSYPVSSQAWPPLPLRRSISPVPLGLPPCSCALAHLSSCRPSHIKASPAYQEGRPSPLRLPPALCLLPPHLLPLPGLRLACCQGHHDNRPGGNYSPGAQPCSVGPPAPPPVLPGISSLTPQRRQ